MTTKNKYLIEELIAIEKTRKAFEDAYREGNRPEADKQYAALVTLYSCLNVNDLLAAIIPNKTKYIQ